MRHLASDHYKTLQLKRTASGTDIATAYMRLVCEHTPENVPGQFKLISEAYRVLSGGKTRDLYNLEKRLPKDVESELDYISSVADQNVPTALQQLQKLTQSHPQHAILRYRLGILLHHHQQYPAAAEIFQALHDAHPKHPFYSIWLGDALLHSGEKSRGLACLKKAIARDKRLSNAYICIALHHTGCEEYDKASEILGRGIRAVRKVDFQSIPMFMQQIVVLAQKEDWSALDSHARGTISALGKRDKKTQQFAGVYLAALTAPLIARCPDLRKYVVDVRCALDPENEELARQSQQISPAAGTGRDRANLARDRDVPKWLKGLVHALHSHGGPENERKAVVAKLADRYAKQGEAMDREWDQAKQRYPDLLEPLTPNWESFRGAVTKAKKQVEAKKQGSDQEGCMVLIVILIAVTIVAVTM